MRLSLLTLGLVVLLASCKDDPTPAPTNQNLTLSFSLTDGNQVVVPGGTFGLWDSVTVNLDVFRMYISRISLRTTSGNWLEVKDVVLLEANKPETMTYTWSIPVGTYTAIRLGIGLDSLLNAQEPSTFPPTHPLASAKGMHWSWAQQYRFISTEGRAVTATRQSNYAHHPGRNDMYRGFVLEKSIGANAHLKFDLNLKSLYDGPAGVVNPMDVQGIHVTPDDIAFAFILMDNSVSAIGEQN